MGGNTLVVKTGELPGEEHIIFADHSAPATGTITRVYQFRLELPGGAHGCRHFKGRYTSSLEQAREDRQKCFDQLAKIDERIDKLNQSSQFSGSKMSPRSPATSPKAKSKAAARK